MSLTNKIKDSEGFNGNPYNDSLGIPTIGYGTKLPLSKLESEMIMMQRLNAKISELESKKPFVKTLPDSKQDVLYEMSYQLGVRGLLLFKRMWKAIENENFDLASKEMLNSLWATQTPARAKKLSEIMKS
jgi:lysozyme